MSTHHLYFLAATFNCVLCLRVLESTLAIEDDGTAITGAKLISKSDNVSVRDLTVCIRFHLALLADFEGRSRVLTIEDWRYDRRVTT